MDPGDLDRVDVLLVDDDPEWVSVASRSLEDTEDALTVLTATGGREALELVDRESFDCVVCDFRMPGIDGLEVLHRVRETTGDLPFILVTGSGSEEVASSAISSAVTDYFVKDPARDQSDTLAARILSAVASHRTGEQLAAARRRFTGLFENVPSPVAIVDDGGDVYRVNDAFERSFGVREANVEGLGIEAPLDGDIASLAGEGSTVETVSLPTTDGDRDFLVRRFPLEDGSGYEGFVFTDVTAHRDRQRDLERALELDSQVRDLLLSSSSKGSLEESFCESLLDAPDVLLAVVAERTTDGGIRVRARAGEADLPVASEDPKDVEARAGGPLSAALVDRSVGSTDDIDAGDGQWSGRAGEVGIRSALAVPLVRNGVHDGAVAVYADAPAAFVGDRANRLADLVDSLGTAVDLVERMEALAAERVTRLRLTVTHGGPLSEAASGKHALEVRTVRPDGSGTGLYVEPEQVARMAAVDDVESTDRASMEEALAGDDRIIDVTTIDEDLDRYRVETAGRTVPDVITDAGAVVHSLRVRDGTYDATIDVPPTVDVESVVDAVRSAFDDVDVHSIRTHERRTDEIAAAEGFASLTDKQRETLQTAYVEGYFEQPRARSASEVAETMGISASTFLQHLRAAQRKLFSAAFGGDGNGA